MKLPYEVEREVINRKKPNCMIIGNKQVYYTEIIHPDVFKELYLAEKPAGIFFSIITTKTDKPFCTLYTKERAFLNIEEGNVIAVRLRKGYKEFQFISKVYEWGKINIPPYIIASLKINNHEKIEIKIIGKNRRLVSGKSKKDIDIYKLAKEKTKIIPRANGYISLYSKAKHAITLPRFIKAAPALFEVFFLIHGDGHYKTKLFFVNKNPELINLVMDKFESLLRIPRGLWRARLMISKLENEKYAKTYWIKQLELDNDQFYSTSKTAFNTCKNGNMRIVIDKLIVAEVFRMIFERLNGLLDDKNSFYALNGLLCAEGGAQISKVGLHRITLSFNKDEKDLFENILNKTSILPLCKIAQNKMFVIEKGENQYKFFKILILNGIIPFEHYTERKGKAISGFLQHQFSKTMKKYISALRLGRYIETKNLSNLLGIRNDSILHTLKSDKYKTFTNIIKDRNRYNISIGKEGKIFLMLFDKMKKIKEEMDMNKKLPYEVERDIIVKKEASTDARISCAPEERDVEELITYGIINLNKPAGPTSHQVADYVKTILKIAKAGHSGTLEGY